MNKYLKGQVQIKVSNVCSLTNLSPMDACNGEKLFVSLGGLTLILLSTWMSLIVLKSTLHFLKVSMIKRILRSNGIINSFLTLIFILSWYCFLGGLEDSLVVTKEELADCFEHGC